MAQTILLVFNLVIFYLKHTSFDDKMYKMFSLNPLTVNKSIFQTFLTLWNVSRLMPAQVSVILSLSFCIFPS